MLVFLLISQAAAAGLASPDFHIGEKSTATPPPPTPTPYCPESYLELMLDKPLIEVGETFGLTVIYHNLGLPWVYGVGLHPEGLAVLDPPIEEWPCERCSYFTLRAVSAGLLEISMCATGEIYCNGWMWSGACSKTPAVVQIVPQLWRMHLPVVSRES